MKRLLIILLAFFMIIGITPVSAKEKAENYNWGFPETSEPAMPHYGESRSNFEYTLELREKWLNEVIEYNEKIYGQHVIKAVEEADSYWLYFETIEKESQNNIIDSTEGPEKIKYEEWAVEKIQYIKPESFKGQPATASSTITVNGTPPTNYDSQAKKSYYDNNTWMINKAIEMMHMGGYVDVYAICTNLE